MYDNLKKLASIVDHLPRNLSIPIDATFGGDGSRGGSEYAHNYVLDSNLVTLLGPTALGVLIGALKARKGEKLRGATYGGGVGASTGIGAGLGVAGGGLLGAVAASSLASALGANYPREGTMPGTLLGALIGGGLGGYAGYKGGKRVVKDITKEDSPWEKEKPSNTKSSGMYGHYIHTEGLNPKQQQALNDIVADIGKWRSGIAKAQLDRGYQVSAGGSTNWRDDAIEAFIEKYPKLAERIWPGSTMEFIPPRGKRRFLKLLPGKTPPAEGYSVITSHNAALPPDDPDLGDDDLNAMMAEWSRKHPPKFNAAVDAYTPMPRSFYEALSELTGGEYQIPEGV